MGPGGPSICMHAKCLGTCISKICISISRLSVSALHSWAAQSFCRPFAHGHQQCSSLSHCLSWNIWPPLPAPTESLAVVIHRHRHSCDCLCWNACSRIAIHDTKGGPECTQCDLHCSMAHDARSKWRGRMRTRRGRRSRRVRVWEEQEEEGRDEEEVEEVEGAVGGG